MKFDEISLEFSVERKLFEIKQKKLDNDF